MPSTYNQSFSNFEIDLHADIKKYDLSMSQITMVSNIPIKGVSVASRFMFNSKVMIALLMTASLVMSPIVVADETEDIPTNAIGTGIHDSLVAALSQAGLVSTLSGDGPFTVFAPTDDAFAAAGIDLASFDTDEENATLFDILTYHVVLGQVMSTNLTDGMTATALNGDDLSFTVSADAVTVSGATVTSADVMASNGVIHVIDTVLMPPVPYTGIGVCYNTDTHMIAAGSSMEECNAYMYLVDYEMGGQTYTGCYNSVSHAMANVSQAVCESYIWTPPVDIPTSATATGIHTSLVAALAAADLVSALQADGPFTVFAPTDDAFAAAGIDLASFDTAEEIATLADILSYHVVPGQVMSTNLTDGMTATALNGDDLSFTVSADAVTVSGATVTLADVPASNGVIHVIDTVLMPPVPAPVIPEGCDYLVGIDDSGYAFDHTSLEIAVGETVCWIWTDSSMAHNVAETATAEDTTRLVGGLYSGAATSSVDYRVTFDANETFTYICEPHATMNMNGIVVVGTGVEDVVTPTEKEDSDATPGFGGALLVLAVMGAVLVTTQRSKLD